MKIKVVLILLLSFVFQTNEAMVLWNMPQISKVAVSKNIYSHSCCKSTDTATSGCTEGTKDDGHNRCNHNCGGPACHCPSVTMVSIVYPIVENKNAHLIFSSEKSTWKFDQQLPASVYFPIWSPPKLG